MFDRFGRRAKATWCALLVLAAVASTPVTSAEAQVPPTAAEGFEALRATSTCHGGGRIELRVVPVSPRGYTLTATAWGLTPGKRWQGELSAGDESEPNSVSFRARARDGGWTTTATIRVPERKVFIASAWGPRPRDVNAIGHYCTALIRLGPPFLGSGGCRKGGEYNDATGLVRDRDTGQHVIFGAEVAPRSQWRVTFSAMIDGVLTSKSVSAVARGDGLVVGRVQFVGDVTTRLRVVADGTQPRDKCFVAFSKRLANPNPTGG